MPHVTLSMGMGVDSAALLTRWLLDPSTRTVPDPATGELVPFELEDLVAVSAMTGDESEATREAMERHLLPLMRVHGVRYVQLCRMSMSETDGVEVLSDSRATERMVMRGRVTLSGEMFDAGTIPQVSSRKCSYRFKGWVLDTWAAEEYGGAPRVHIVGYAAEETGRRDRDVVYAVAAEGKVPFYPLIDPWGWDRAQCLAYLFEIYGIEWPRSCCGFCPYQAGPDIARMAQRWAREPQQAATAVAMERNARALNPRMVLFGDRSAEDVARSFGLGAVVDQAAAELDARPHALYEVRRIYRRRGDRRDKSGASWVLGPDPFDKGTDVWRSLRTHATGTRAEMVAALLAEAGRGAGEVEHVAGGFRLVFSRASAPYPTVERYLAVAVAGADKERDAFDELWTWVLSLDLPRQGDLFELALHVLITAVHWEV
jgi:hypothetical protein